MIIKLINDILYNKKIWETNEVIEANIKVMGSGEMIKNGISQTADVILSKRN